MMDRRTFLGTTVAAGALALWRPATASPRQDAAPVVVIKRPWAGIELRAGASLLFVDPVPETEGMPARFAADSATGDGATVLISHHHADHFAPPTVRTLTGGKGALVATAGVLRFADTRGLRTVQANEWDPVFVPGNGDDMVAFAVPAVDGFGAPQVSWIVDTGGHRFFHAGDTQWHGRFGDYGRAYGPFTAAFLPVNGARQNVGRFHDVGIPAVLTPEQAVEAALALGARTLVPIHFGEPDPPVYLEASGIPERLASASRSRGMALKILADGASWTIAPRD
ncbi:MAG: MBL fold metallo-hydrolase [Lysobacteraceae bacterium]